MIEKQIVKDIVEAFLQNTDYQLIDLTISADNRIVVEIDSFEGVDIDFCAQLTHHIESQLNRDKEDYELEVGSSGLTTPFKVLMQYQKNIGNPVEILTKEGKKLHGQLVDADEDKFLVDIEEKVQIEGKKRKETQIITHTFKYDEVKYTLYDLKI
ncbi:MAG: ribosome assembly cofactor RimP [Paludibacteraceae bacterium]|nr:ribosome assembly cofactor RimP [Paludibacteraceae bacterium]